MIEKHESVECNNINLSIFRLKLSLAVEVHQS